MVKYPNKGRREGNYLLFNTNDHMNNVFDAIPLRIEVSLLECLSSKYFNKKTCSLAMDIFYNKQKGVNKWEPMYYEPPKSAYKPGQNLQPLKTLLFPKYPCRSKWCFKDGDRMHFSSDNVYTMSYSKYKNLPTDEKPACLDETNVVNANISQALQLPESTKQFEHDGVKYLRDSNNVLYTWTERGGYMLIGMWDEEEKVIIK